jgi:hypothetical protein
MSQGISDGILAVLIAAQAAALARGECVSISRLLVLADRLRDVVEEWGA